MKRDQDVASLDDRSAWVILSYRESQKPVVVQQLMACGYRFYAPMIRKLTRFRGVRMIMGVPLYRGFMFIWRADGCYVDTDRMIGTAGRFQRGVRPCLIERHRQAEVDGYIQLIKPVDKLDVVLVGDRCQTLDGYMDLVVSQVVDDKRVMALTYLLGREHEVVVDLSCVAKIAKKGLDE